MYFIQLLFLRIIPRVRGLFFRIWILMNGGKCGYIIVESGFRLKYPPHKGLVFGNQVCFGKHTTLDVPRGASLMIGDRVSFTGYSYISSAKKVSIGHDVIAGEFVSIRDAHHGTSIQNGLPIKDQEMFPGAITLENDIWIGRGVCILKGVSISSGIVIGSNSVVNQSLHIPQGIYAGTPCQFIKNRI